jgi:putative peptidoglycan lipid II flippase
MVVALAFGAGPVTDAFFVAFRIPNMLRRLLAEGALSTAVIPIFTDYAVHQPREEFVRMLRAVLGGALVVLCLVTALGVATAPWLVSLIAPGFSRDPAQATLAAALTRLMFPYLLLIGLAALAMGALNAHGRFFAAAFGPAVQNLGMILTVVLLATHLEPPILSLAIGVLLGGLGQLAVQLPGLRATGCLVLPSGDLAHPAVLQTARLLVPAAFGLAAVQVTVFVNTLLASLLAPGSISFLYYADRVMEFPLGVFGIALASASLPAMARQAAVGDTRAVAGTLNFALRLSFFIALPATVGLVLLRVPITRVLFERGRFTAADSAATADALLWYAVGLAGFSAARIAAQAFYAARTPGVAVTMGIASVAVDVVAALALMGPLRHAGLAAASSAAAYVNLAGLVWVARRRFGAIGIRDLARSVARTLAASGVLALWCGLAAWLWPAAPGTRVDAAWLLGAVLIGGLVFVAAAWALRAPELASLQRTLLRRGTG